MYIHVQGRTTRRSVPFMYCYCVSICKSTIMSDMEVSFDSPLLQEDRKLVQELKISDSIHIAEPFVEPDAHSFPGPAAKRRKTTEVRCKDSEAVCEDPFMYLNDSITFPKPYQDPINEAVPIIKGSQYEYRDGIYQHDKDPSNEHIIIEPPMIEDITFDEDDSKSTFLSDFGGSAEKLFPGSKLSALQAVTMLISWFSMFPGMSKEAFNRLLYLLHTFILPEDNKMPSSYYLAQKKIKPYLSPVKEYHVCPNDCIIYRNCDDGKYECLTECPICGEGRFFHDEKIPRKVFKYLSIGTRLKRLFSDSTTSQLLQNHFHSSSDHNLMVSNIHQSKVWYDWYKDDGIYSGDKRVLSFAFCTDGLNPFAQHKNNYSMWPIFLIPLNLPHHIRSKSGAMMLTGIIPGPSEPETLQPYLDLVVDDLAQLGKMTFYDAYRNEDFKPQAYIQMYVCDYPGQNKIFDTHGAGAYSGCTYCCIKGEYSKTLDKMVYLDHRCFLPHKDALRKDKNNFPSKKVCISQPPQLKTTEFVDKAIEKVLSAETKREKKTILQEVGCRGRYSFRKLPYHDRLLNTPVEPMHTIKNISEHIIKLLSGSKDSLKVRQEEKQRKRFSMSWVNSDESQQKVLPPAPFTLSKNEREIANSRALSILPPTGFDWKPRKLFIQNGIGYIKSIEWKHILTCGILKYCLRDLLGEKQRTALFELCDVVTLLTAKNAISTVELAAIEYRLHRVLSLIERDFPVSLNVISFHLLHHLPMYVRHFGPVYEFHMFPMERFNSWISKRVMNRRFPETTVLESYRLFELSFFLQISGRIPSGACCDMADENDGVDTCESSSGNLSSDEMKALESVYKTIDPDYANLVSVYEKERDQAKKAHKLRHFPALSHWEPGDESILSPYQLGLRCGPSTSIVDCYSHTLKDDHGQAIKYSAVKASKNKTSSCVGLSPSSVFYRGELKFGQIVRIFHHIFNKKKHTLALIQWFCDVEQDQQSGLYFSSITIASPCQVLPIEHLSKPLIHAVDNCKIWFLNFSHI